MTTTPCNADFDALTSTVPTSDYSDQSTNSGSASAKRSTNTAKPQTNTIGASTNTPVTSSVLAERYDVGDRTVQLWVKRLVEEAGIPESEVKENSGNQTTYTAYCVELLDSLHSHRSEGKKLGQWFSALAHEQAQRTVNQATSQSSSSNSEESLGIASSGQLAIATGVIPGEIALATDRQQSMLDSAIERFTPQPTHLNGQQESNLSGLELLIGAVDQATAINDQRESDLQEREATVEKSEQVLELVRDRLQTEQKRSKSLNQKTTEIGEREQAVSDLLGKLGVSQQS